MTEPREPREPTQADESETRVELGASAQPSEPDAGPSLPRGATLGRYVILETLGTGGMGEVFSAYDPELDRRIALKLVKLRTEEHTEQARDRLLREAQALAKLSHPNVVAVYDVGTHGDRVFIAMEHVEGQTIRDWIDSARKDLSSRWQEGLRLMLQAGRGLAAAHAEGLVHRDFKPANVMVDAEGRVRVLDFGLARRFGDDEPVESRSHDAVLESRDSGRFSHGSRTSLRTQLTQVGMVMGTPAYMAPEQFFGGDIDERTDQFSFCVVLHRVLLGIRPFEGKTYAEVRRAVGRGELRDPPRTTRVPRRVRQVLRRGLSVSREARYPTMDALLDDLERAAGAGRRRIAVAATAGMALLGVAGVATLMTRAETSCRGAEAKLEGRWDEQTRGTMAAAFEATAVVYADDARIAATRALDEYAARWLALHTQICEATRVRGDQSETLMDLRIGCLDAKLRDVTALTTVFASADADVVKNATQAVQALPSPDGCVTLERSAAELLQPGDPELGRAVEAVREDVARARARALSGKYDDALVLGRAAHAAAREAGYPPVIAEAALVLGDLHERKMSGELALEAYEEALHAAAASGHAFAEARALLGLLSVLGTHLTDTEAALRYGRHAEAVVERLGDPPELQAAVFLYRGNANLLANRLEAARGDLLRAIDLSGGIPAAERIHLAALNNLAAVHGQQGRYREAVETFLRVVELTEVRLGPSHPSVGSNHLGLGVAYSRLEKYERAMHHTRKALEIYEAALGPEHPEVGRGHHNLGVVQSALGDIPAAYESYRRALEIKTEGLGPDHTSVAYTANNVGDALVKLGRPAEALPYLEDALRIGTRAHGEDNSRNVFALVSLAEAHLALDRPAEAVPLIRRALAMAEAGELDPVEVAKALFVAARAVLRAGGDRSEALELARQAKAGYEVSERPSMAEREAIEAFLADPA